MQKIEYNALLRHYDDEVNIKINNFNNFLKGLIKLNYPITGMSNTLMKQCIDLEERLLSMASLELNESADTDETNNNDKNKRD